MKVRRATIAQDKEIALLAKQSPYTKGFLDVYARIDLPQLYERSYVGVIWKGEKLLGFVYTHHLIRKPYSSIYYMGVDAAAARKGLGKTMVEWVMRNSPWKKIRLSCEEDNEAGMRFYESLSFKEVGRGTNKKGKILIYLELS